MKMFPTPAARDWKDTGENTDYEKLAKKSKLAGAVKSKMYPTPRSSIGMSMSMDTVVKAMDNNDRGYKGNLEERVAIEQKMWPTPRASNPGSRPNGKGGKILNEEVMIAEGLRERGEKMWPTPNASDNRDRGNMSDPAIQRRLAKGKQVGLTMAVKDKPGKGTLNPEWVEWLMGYPQGWTDISDSSESPTSQE
jgi:DNA (cytosine-5)-methyltransferase 1